MNKPVIGVPIGDPAGIGPEIALKAIMHKELLEKVNIILIGHEGVLKQMIDICDLPLRINRVESIEKAVFNEGTVNLFHLDNIDMESLILGEINPMCAKAAFDYIKTSVVLSDAGQIDAIATTPINKESLKAGQIPYIGHTEMFSYLTHTKDPLTMFEIDQLRVFFLSRHVSLKEAINMVKKDRIEDYIERSIKALKRLGVKGRLAVAGLNPHSGEHGLFGREEMDEILPAIKSMRAKGYDVVGPIPADSVFAIGLSGKWAGVLSLYHDQGHIATKTYDFHRTISITNGMPLLRTSVDHGTAMDIAGKNMANEISMVEAIRLAGQYAPFFKVSD